MKKSVFSSALMAGLLAVGATNLSAADLKMGAGVGVTGNTSVLRGTLQFAPDMRVEPFFTYSYNDPDKGESTSNLGLGAAFHIIQPLNSKVRTYFGALAGVNSNDNGTTTNTVFSLGPVAGAEYFLDPHFTLGAEANLYFGFGDSTTVGTNTTAMLRYYF